MKLKPVQWLWIVAFVLGVASVLLDIVGFWNVPPIYMLLGSTLLLCSNWFVMPSMKEMDRAMRRRR